MCVLLMEVMVMVMVVRFAVLAIWATKAGAKRVYAVEATDMAKHAKVLVEANGLSDVVDIRQSMVEALEIPEKVDIIVSEW